MNTYRLTLLNPFVWDKFWMAEHEFKDANDLKEQYNKFVNNNIDNITKINEMLDNGLFDELNESYGYDLREEVSGMIVEAMLGKRKTEPVITKTTYYNDDDFIPDELKTKVEPQKTIDDIEREQTAKDVTIIEKPKPTVAKTPDGVKIVRNIGYDSKSINDIHYCVRAIYRKLIKEDKNYDIYTPFTLLDTENVEEMDALFAFLDVPNIDLSTWNVSNVVNMEGMFYKSTFNNDSIKDWDVSRVRNMRNMFIGSDMTNEEYIKNWYPNTMNHALPKIGVDTTKDMLDTDSAIDKLFGSAEEIEKNAKRRKQMQYNGYESYHVMSSSEFISEGKFTDYIQRGVEKTREIVKAISIKFKNGMTWLFDKFGNMMNVVTPESSVDYIESNNVAGVCLSNNWYGVSGVYENIPEGSQEYNNYLEFINRMGTSINEARVSMSANVSKANDAPAPNINVNDWNTAELSDWIEKQVFLTQAHPGREKRTLVVWGAPGIGKSSIPKNIIDEMNKKGNRTAEQDRMTVLVADCSQMTSDGFALPTPAKQMDVDSLVKSNAAASAIAKANGMTKDELNAIEYKVSADAPKTWLPVYKPTGDPKQDKILNALANGCTQPIYDKDGYVSGFEKTGSGGILLIDEFLRADQNIFFIVCQLMFNYKYGEYVLGDKWQIIAASNRPSDDKEVRRKFADSAAAGYNRLAFCNFVPRFAEWKGWAEKHGFDETTLSFIAEKSEDGPDSRWHNFDPELKNSQNSPMFVSPRSWSDAIKELQDECEFRGYEHYSDIPKNKFKTLVGLHLPEKITQEYTDYYYINNEYSNPYKYDNIINDPELVVSDKNKYKCANVINSIVTAIKLRYNQRKRIPVNEFNDLMKFLCKNYTDSNIIYSNFYQEVFKICNLSETQELENSYDIVGDTFATAFPVFAENL